MKRTPFTGEGLFRKKLPPRTPPQKLFGCFLGWRGQKQRRQKYMKSISGGGLFEKSPSPDPSSKTFQVFFLLARTETGAAKSDFPAYFHFAVRRKFICFRGKQISSADTRISSVCFRGQISPRATTVAFGASSLPEGAFHETAFIIFGLAVFVLVGASNKNFLKSF